MRTDPDYSFLKKYGLSLLKGLVGLVFLFGLVLHHPSDAGRLVWLPEGLETLRWNGMPVSVCVVQKNANQWRSSLTEIHLSLKKHHDTVRQSTGQDRNVVVAGLSHLAELSDPEKAYTGGFFEYTTDGDAKILAFVSGTTFAGDAPKGYSVVGLNSDYKLPARGSSGIFYPLEKVFSEFSQRGVNLQNEGVLVNPRASMYWDAWQREHERILEEQKQKLELIVKPGRQVAEKPSETIFSLHTKIQSLLAEGIHDMSCNIGAIVDSEQLLLRFLEDNPLSRSVSIWKGREDLFSSVFGPFMAALNREKFGSKAKPNREELDQYIEQQKTILDEVAALRKPVEERRFCGAIFHIHSTNEICASCMEHLLYEFEHAQNFQDIRQRVGGILYLIVTCDRNGLQDGPDRPGGGANESLFGPHDILELFKEGVYPQFKLEEREGRRGSGIASSSAQK